MKPRTLLLLVVAIGCGLVAAFMVNQISGRPASQDTESVFTAAKDIPMGTPMTSENLKAFVKKSDLPKGMVPLNAIKEQKDLENKVIGRGVSANSAITVLDVSNSTESVVRELDPGYRAITVRATLENAHHGFVLPGSRVDVICTTQLINDQRITLSRIFLQNVKVLACNTLTSQPQESQTVGNPVTVTLAVKPDEAERMYWVTSRTIVGILLRKPGDENKVETTGVIGPYEEDKPGGDPKTTTGQSVQVPVATRNFDSGDVITTDQVKMMPFQKAQLPPDVILSVDDLRDQPVHRFISSGSFITRAHLTPLGVKVAVNGGTPGKVHRLTIFQSPNRPEVHDFPLGPDGKPIEAPAPREQVPPGSAVPTPKPAPGTLAPPPSGRPSESKE